MTRVFIAMGSNIRPERNIRLALELLRRLLRVTRVSTFYRTEPVGPPGQPRFVNGVVEAWTALPLNRLKTALKKIEADLGRHRAPDRYAPRTIDLDLLVYNGKVRSGETPLPDPEIERRAFLALPLNELAPDLILPGSSRRITEVAAALAAEGSLMEPMLPLTLSLREERNHGPRQD